MTTETEPGEFTNERILSDLDDYANGGMLDYVLPTTPLGEQWIVGYQGRILKFATKEGIAGFLIGIQVGALFAVKVRNDIVFPGDQR